MLGIILMSLTLLSELFTIGGMCAALQKSSCPLGICRRPMNAVTKVSVGLFSLSTAFISSMMALGDVWCPNAERNRLTAADMNIVAGMPFPLTSPMMNHRTSP